MTLTFSISLSSQIHGGKLEFFPLLVALTLGEEEDQTARHLEELKAMVRDVLDRFKAEVRVCVSVCLCVGRADKEGCSGAQPYV